MAEPEIVDYAEIARDRSISLNNQADQLIIESYIDAYDDMVARIEADAERRFEQYDGEILFDAEQARLLDLTTELEAAIPGSTTAITEGMDAQLRQSLYDGNRFMRANSTAGVKFGVLNTDAIDALAARIVDDQRISNLLKHATKQQEAKLHAELLKAQVLGQNPREAARKLRDSAKGMQGATLARWLTIARTEMVDTNRKGLTALYQRNSHVLRAKERHCAFDERTCMACIALDGTIYDLDAVEDDHQNGRCTWLPVLKEPYAKQMGKRQLASQWFMKQDSKIQRSMMGGTMFDLWKAGDIDLEDFAVYKNNHKWRGAFYSATINEAKTQKSARQRIFRLVGKGVEVGLAVDAGLSVAMRLRRLASHRDDLVQLKRLGANQELWPERLIIVKRIAQRELYMTYHETLARQALVQIAPIRDLETAIKLNLERLADLTVAEYGRIMFMAKSGKTLIQQLSEMSPEQQAQFGTMMRAMNPDLFAPNLTINKDFLLNVTKGAMLKYLQRRAPYFVDPDRLEPPPQPGMGFEIVPQPKPGPMPQDGGVQLDLPKDTPPPRALPSAPRALPPGPTDWLDWLPQPEQPLLKRLQARLREAGSILPDARYPDSGLVHETYKGIFPGRVIPDAPEGRPSGGFFVTVESQYWESYNPNLSIWWHPDVKVAGQMDVDQIRDFITRGHLEDVEFWPEVLQEFKDTPHILGELSEVKGGFHYVGATHRKIDSPTRVYNSSMNIPNNWFRALGFASQFNAQSFAFYITHGVEEVGIQAVDDGRYVWASQGFHAKNARDTVEFWIKQASSRIQHAIRVGYFTEQDLSRWLNIVLERAETQGGMTFAEFTRLGDEITWTEPDNLGVDQEFWFGKYVIYKGSSGFYGTLFLKPPTMTTIFGYDRARPEVLFPKFPRYIGADIVEDAIQMPNVEPILRAQILTILLNVEKYPLSTGAAKFFQGDWKKRQQEIEALQDPEIQQLNAEVESILELIRQRLLINPGYVDLQQAVESVYRLRFTKPEADPHIVSYIAALPGPIQSIGSIPAIVTRNIEGRTFNPDAIQLILDTIRADLLEIDENASLSDIDRFDVARLIQSIPSDVLDWRDEANFRLSQLILERINHSVIQDDDDIEALGEIVFMRLDTERMFPAQAPAPPPYVDPVDPRASATRGGIQSIQWDYPQIPTRPAEYDEELALQLLDEFSPGGLGPGFEAWDPQELDENARFMWDEYFSGRTPQLPTQVFDALRQVVDDSGLHPSPEYWVEFQRYYAAYGNLRGVLWESELDIYLELVDFDGTMEEMPEAFGTEVEYLTREFMENPIIARFMREQDVINAQGRQQILETAINDNLDIIYSAFDEEQQHEAVINIVGELVIAIRTHFGSDFAESMEAAFDEHDDQIVDFPTNVSRTQDALGVQLEQMFDNLEEPLPTGFADRIFNVVNTWQDAILDQHFTPEAWADWEYIFREQSANTRRELGVQFIDRMLMQGETVNEALTSIFARTETFRTPIIRRQIYESRHIRASFDLPPPRVGFWPQPMVSQPARFRTEDAEALRQAFGLALGYHASVPNSEIFRTYLTEMFYNAQNTHHVPIPNAFRSWMEAIGIEPNSTQAREIRNQIFSNPVVRRIFSLPVEMSLPEAEWLDRLDSFGTVEQDLQRMADAITNPPTQFLAAPDQVAAVIEFNRLLNHLMRQAAQQTFDDGLIIASDFNTINQWLNRRGPNAMTRAELIIDWYASEQREAIFINDLYEESHFQIDGTIFRRLLRANQFELMQQIRILMTPEVESAVNTWYNLLMNAPRLQQNGIAQLSLSQFVYMWRTSQNNWSVTQPDPNNLRSFVDRIAHSGASYLGPLSTETWESAHRILDQPQFQNAWIQLINQLDYGQRIVSTPVAPISNPVADRLMSVAYWLERPILGVQDAETSLWRAAERVFHAQVVDEDLDDDERHDDALEALNVMGRLTAQAANATSLQELLEILNRIATLDNQFRAAVEIYDRGYDIAYVEASTDLDAMIRELQFFVDAEREAVTTEIVDQLVGPSPTEMGQYWTNLNRILNQYDVNILGHQEIIIRWWRRVNGEWQPDTDEHLDMEHPASMIEHLAAASESVETEADWLFMMSRMSDDDELLDAFLSIERNVPEDADIPVAPTFSLDVLGVRWADLNHILSRDYDIGTVDPVPQDQILEWWHRSDGEWQPDDQAELDMNEPLSMIEWLAAASETVDDHGDWLHTIGRMMDDQDLLDAWSAIDTTLNRMIGNVPPDPVPAPTHPSRYVEEDPPEPVNIEINPAYELQDIPFEQEVNWAQHRFSSDEIFREYVRLRQAGFTPGQAFAQAADYQPQDSQVMDWMNALRNFKITQRGGRGGGRLGGHMQRPIEEVMSDLSIQGQLADSLSADITMQDEKMKRLREAIADALDADRPPAIQDLQELSKLTGQTFREILSEIVDDTSNLVDIDAIKAYLRRLFFAGRDIFEDNPYVKWVASVEGITPGQVIARIEEKPGGLEEEEEEEEGEDEEEFYGNGEPITVGSLIARLEYFIQELEYHAELPDVEGGEYETALHLAVFARGFVEYLRDAENINDALEIFEVALQTIEDRMRNYSIINDLFDILAEQGEFEIDDYDPPIEETLDISLTRLVQLIEQNLRGLQEDAGIEYEDDDITVVDCLFMSQAVAAMFPGFLLKIRVGLFWDDADMENRNRLMPHAWLEFADGTIIDTTQEQFGLGSSGVVVLRPGDPLRQHYRWDSTSEPDMWNIGWEEAIPYDVEEQQGPIDWDNDPLARPYQLYLELQHMLVNVKDQATRLDVQDEMHRELEILIESALGLDDFVEFLYEAGRVRDQLADYLGNIAMIETWTSKLEESPSLSELWDAIQDTEVQLTRWIERMASVLGVDPPREAEERYEEETAQDTLDFIQRIDEANPNALQEGLDFLAERMVPEIPDELPHVLDPSRLGRCYELSGRYVSQGTESDMVLVHGSIEGLGNPRIGHAWVVIPGIGIWEPATNNIWDPEVFQAFFAPVEHHAYTQEEVWTFTLQTEHWGPWDESGSGPVDPQELSTWMRVIEFTNTFGEWLDSATQSGWGDTDIDWNLIPTVVVNLSTVYTQQNYVWPTEIRQYIDNPTWSGEDERTDPENLPWGVLVEGRVFLVDGHHRAIAMWQQGLPVRIRLFEQERWDELSEEEENTIQAFLASLNPTEFPQGPPEL